MVVSSRAVSTASMRDELAAGRRGLLTFREDIDRLRGQVAAVKAIPKER